MTEPHLGVSRTIHMGVFDLKAQTKTLIRVFFTSCNPTDFFFFFFLVADVNTITQ